MAWFNKIETIVQKIPQGLNRIPEGVRRTESTIRGILNPNYRHDDPDEMRADEVRAQIRASHRFDSFGGQRTQNSIKWHIDGHDYMWAVSELIDSAREFIFIMDWWLSPELYLRRPPAEHPEWRLDRLLRRKAEEGVKIYVIVYKEVTQTLTMSSHHTKWALEDLNPNIQCLRHPDHIGSRDNVQYWSHHEKVVVVDNVRGCIGGLDLCFGRWDTHSHPLSDVYPTDFSRTLFPGQDYNNARVSDFIKADNFVDNAVSILETARMPWHDVHMTIAGDVILDIVQHFVERWNEVKLRKYKDNDHFDWLALPHDVESAPNEAVARHPHREKWHQIGRKFTQPFHHHHAVTRHIGEHNQGPHGSCNVQVVRSVSDWSHGVLLEHSIQNAYITLIQEAEHFIYIENQFFISNARRNGGGPIKNVIASALVAKIISKAQAREPFKVIVVIPEVPGFAGDIKETSAVKTVMLAQYRTINRGGYSIYEEIRKAGFEPENYIRFFHLRSYDRIDAPRDTLIDRTERQCGISFHQAQVAQARVWIGPPEHGVKPQEVVTIKKPDPPGAYVPPDPKNKPKNEGVPLPYSLEEAQQVVRHFEVTANQIGGDCVAGSVAQHSLEDRRSLLNENWLGTEVEELNSYVSEILYIHSKVMIVDDRRVIMGSANFNDRSQKGDGDSEIALVVEDTDLIYSTMAGRPYQVARFAATLRRKLFREHLGLITPQACTYRERVDNFMRAAPIPNPDETNTLEDQAVADPLSDDFQNLWNNTAKRNREIFTELFRPVPTNLVRDYAGYSRYIPNVRPGHVVPGVPLDVVKRRLSEVRGHVVECPLDFLIDEKEFNEPTDFTELNPTLPIYL